MTPDEIRTMLDDCEAREERLTEFECGFLDSIGRQFSERGTLTPRQKEMLIHIWDIVTSAKSGAFR